MDQRAPELFDLVNIPEAPLANQTIHSVLLRKHCPLNLVRFFHINFILLLYFAYFPCFFEVNLLDAINGLVVVCDSFLSINCDDCLFRNISRKLFI